MLQVALSEKEMNLLFTALGYWQTHVMIDTHITLEEREVLVGDSGALFDKLEEVVRAAKSTG